MTSNAIALPAVQSSQQPRQPLFLFLNKSQSLCDTLKGGLGNERTWGRTWKASQPVSPPGHTNRGEEH